MRPILAALALLAAACNTGFEPQYRVKELRILAVRSEVSFAVPPASGSTDATFPPADVAPDQTLKLTALVVNPTSAPLTVSWFGCLPGGTDALPPCLDPEILKEPGALAALADTGPQSGVVKIGGVFFPPPAPLTAIPEVRLAVTEPAVRDALAALTALVADQPTYQCRAFVEAAAVLEAEAGGRRQIAVKRVRLTPTPQAAAAPPFSGGYAANRNPAIEGVGVHLEGDTDCGGTVLTPGERFTGFPTGRTFLCGYSKGRSVEGFNVCGPSGVQPPPGEETLSWQWYVTDGAFPDTSSIGNATGDKPDFERPPGEFTIWAILRDGRGGEDWKIYPIGSPP